MPYYLLINAMLLPVFDASLYQTHRLLLPLLPMHMPVVCHPLTFAFIIKI
jgi:hypothetical protein